MRQPTRRMRGDGLPRSVDRVAAAAAAYTGWNAPADRAATLEQLARVREGYVRRSR